MKTKSIILTFAFLLTTLVSSMAHAQVKYPELSESGYHTLQKMSEQLLKECPPEDCVIAFIGRSNVLLSAYLDAKQLGAHVSLPVSGIRYVPEAESVSARERFHHEILERYLEPKLKQAKKILVVDYVHRGGSIAQAAIWIQDFAGSESTVEVMGYGQPLSLEYRNILEDKKIPIKSMDVEGVMARGSVGYLAKESLLEHYAAYDEWNPIYTQSSPKIDPKIRRHYPYYDGPNGQKLYSQYASYDDLVELFKQENPIAHLPKKPPEFDCMRLLGSFVN